MSLYAVDTDVGCNAWSSLLHSDPQIELKGGKMMHLLIDRPQSLMSEWVLSNRISPEGLENRLADHGFAKAAGGYFRGYEGRTFQITWNRKTPSANGFFLYYARYDGTPSDGLHFLKTKCKPLGFNERSFSVFVPIASMSRLKAKLLQHGFEEKGVSTSVQARCFMKHSISVVQFDDGIVLQARAIYNWQWDTLHRQLLRVLESL